MGKHHLVLYLEVKTKVENEIVLILQVGWKITPFQLFTLNTSSKNIWWWSIVATKSLGFPS